MPFNTVSTAIGVLAASALHVPHVLASNVKRDTGCDLLAAAGLQVLLPADSAYAEREASYWAANSQLGPQCIVQPRTTAEVSQAIQIIATTPGNFAVRSGGHSQWSGGSDIQDGITIDLSLMTSVTYDQAASTVSIEPGPRWRDVYGTLEQQGITVVGGRDADVGIGGFLTGGGNSFYTGRYGFGSDAVVNFEVVLADGSVVNANASTNSDLWRALKGGSGNFGIVTRFDTKAFSAPDIWGGMSIVDKSNAAQVITSLVNFTNNNEQNPQDALIVIFLHSANSGDAVNIATVVVDTFAEVEAPAFSEVRQIPTLSQDISTRKLSELTETYKTAGGFRNVWFTLTFNNDPEIIQHAADLHDQLIADLNAEFTNFSSQCLFQPMPAYFAQRGVQEGGNVLGMDSVTTNSILWLGIVAYSDSQFDTLVNQKMAAWTEDIEAFATQKGGNVAWRYLNYADGTQNPLASYGQANVDFIRQVAATYDPNAVFQSKVPGGFKISRI